MSLLESAEALLQLARVLRDATLLIAEGGEVLAANPPAGRMLGRNPHELEGKWLRDLVTDPPEKLDRCLRAYSRSGSPIPGALSFRTDDGGTVECRCDGAVVELRDTGPVIFLRCVPRPSASSTFVALNRELGTLRNEHRRIRQDRERLFGILESINDAFLALDRDWRFTYVNHQAEERWGRSREELLGRNIWEEFPQAVGTEFHSRLKRAVEEGVTTEFETAFPAMDSWISGRAYPSGNGLSVYLQDITERKRVEEAIAEVREAERRRLARDLHDGVLQDLSYTVQAMELTKFQAEETGLEQDLQQEIDALRSAAQELRAVVHNLRLADQLDQPFSRLLEFLVERNREMARTQQIELQIKEGFPSAPLGEPGVEVLRILQEALTNARRHSGARNVLVILRGEANDLVAEVSDDGRGFGGESAPGVGLRSMRERAASLGGTLEVDSEPGGGTTVRLRVPMPRRL